MTCLTARLSAFSARDDKAERLIFLLARMSLLRCFTNLRKQFSVHDRQLSVLLFGNGRWLHRRVIKHRPGIHQRPIHLEEMMDAPAKPTADVRRRDIVPTFRYSSLDARYRHFYAGNPKEEYMDHIALLLQPAQERDVRFPRAIGSCNDVEIRRFFVHRFCARWVRSLAA